VSGDPEATAPKRTLLAWSSGKDSAFALHELQRDPAFEVVGLLTTINAARERVAMHAVRVELLERQAEAAGLPLWPVRIPEPCSNEQYERAMGEAMERATKDGITAVAFGDLFLEEVRAYREKQLAKCGIEPLFPLWGRDTKVLARTMLDAGLRAVLTCVDSKQCPRHFAGRAFDETLLQELPASVDPCGERGEFHTFAWAGPMFRRPIPVQIGERRVQGRFVFTDLLPEAAPAPR
jgi:uncharacterized protein (TIGR00290 family)